MSNIEILENGVEYTVLHTKPLTRRSRTSWRGSSARRRWTGSKGTISRIGNPRSSGSWRTIFATASTATSRDACTGRRTADCPGISAGWASAPDWRAER